MVVVDAENEAQLVEAGFGLGVQDERSVGELSGSGALAAGQQAGEDAVAEPSRRIRRAPAGQRERVGPARPDRSLERSRFNPTRLDGRACSRRRSACSFVIKLCVCTSTGYTGASFEVKYLEIELSGKVAVEPLDVKSFFVKTVTMKKVEERDHIDEWLEKAWLQDIPNLDFAVEGIVDRMSGLTRRFKRSLNDVLAEHGLTFEEWDVLGALRRAGPPFRRSAGELAKFSELSSGAMTNRLDRLEKAGFVKRLPDPDDRRGVLIELTKAGGTAWLESTGAEAEREALIAAALTKTEKEQLNALLRRLMLEFERREGSESKKP